MKPLLNLSHTRPIGLVQLAVVVLLTHLALALVPGSLLAVQGAEGRYSGKQGQVLVVKVLLEDESATVQGTFLGRSIRFFPDPRLDEPKGFVGLLGIDLQDEPGTHDLLVDLKQGEQSRTLNYSVSVVKEKFHIEHLTLPKDKVDLDEKAVARWKAEQEQIKTGLAVDSQARLWQPGFVEPVSGRRTGIFGSVRIMNGQPRNPHNGEDISARLTVDHFFSGKGLFLDHGQGFYSMYFHLSEVLVKDGDVVKAGQIVGKVGATGRATGPHLHWGVKLNGARVNPYSLLDLPFKGAVQSATPASVSLTEPASGMGSPTP
jgi:murein DD-endopeptidase MepM/ murein hydrolase activator NlpD